MNQEKPKFSFETIEQNQGLYAVGAQYAPRSLLPWVTIKIESTRGEFKYIKAKVVPLVEYLNRDMQKALLNRFSEIYNEFDYSKAFKDLNTIVKPVCDILNLCKFDDLSLLHNDMKRQEFADNVAVNIRYQLENFCKTACRNEIEYDTAISLTYDFLVSVTDFHGFAPPYNNKAKKPLSPEQCESGILRLVDGEYWQGKFDRSAKQIQEHIAIALGYVRKNYSPYVSKQALSDHKTQQEANQAYLEMMDVIDKESGEKRSLAELAKLGSADPEKRRIEMMVRCRGLEDLSLKQGKEAVFLTITAPSKYHKNSPKWNLASPKETSNYLCGVWSKIRAKLGRMGVDYDGVRVSEPHCDATPHWHILLFVEKSQRDLLINTCRAYATSEDESELWSTWAKHQTAVKNGRKTKPRKHWYSPRFVSEIIDPEKGSATGYIAKYISKNINGSKMGGEIDDEAEIQISESAQRVVAWASMWSIRQFQFFGAASVTVWRECRRVKAPFECESMELIRQAADKGNWQEFSEEMQKNKLVVAYEDTDERNDYNELITRVCGVKFPSLDALITRVKSFELKKRSLSLSWSPVINCTGVNSEPLNKWTLSDKTKNNFKKMGFCDGSLNFLLSGNAVFIRGQKFEVLNGQVVSN